MQVSVPRQRIANHLAELVHQGHCIQYVNPYDLVDALTRSADLRHDLGDTMAHDFLPLLYKKLANCSDYFLADLDEKGIQEPVVIIVCPDGNWELDQGHHRLAWALCTGDDVPVFFDENCPDDENSKMPFRLARPGIELYHNSIGGESSDDALAVSRVPVQDGVVLVPQPRAGVKSGAQAKHRV